MPLALRSVRVSTFLVLISIVYKANSTLEIFEDELDWTAGSVLGLQRGFKLTKGHSASSELALGPESPEGVREKKVVFSQDEETVEVRDSDGLQDKRGVGSMVRSEPT